MNKPNIKLRDPSIVMKLSRLGSFHQSKLSFLRSFIREFKKWNYKRNLFDLDKNGYGTAVYSFAKKGRNYSLIYNMLYIILLVYNIYVGFINISLHTLPSPFSNIMGNSWQNTDIYDNAE